jgi:hypothetical protein
MRPIAAFVVRPVHSFLIIAIAASIAIMSPVLASAGTSSYVYVGSPLTAGSAYIDGFAVAPNGSAPPVSGSPVYGASSSVVGVSHYLFATDATNIVTYTVASDGSLSQTSSVNGKAYDMNRQSSAVGGLSITPDGRSIYTDELYYDGANNVYQAWKVALHGQLSYVASSGLPLYATAGGFPFSYSASSVFAYTWSPCNRDGAVWGFARRANGSLARMNPAAQPPPPQQGQGGSDCSQAVAVSSLGYVAVAWNGDFCCGGPPIIATYAIQGSGSLSLVAGSEQNIACDYSPMAFDPTGRYLAVACNGVQVYSLEAKGQLTPIGAAQERSVPFGTLAWDNANHVYGIPQTNWTECQNNGSACGLYVFNSSAGNLSLALGSPHTVTQPGSLAVLPAQ